MLDNGVAAIFWAAFVKICIFPKWSKCQVSDGYIMADFVTNIADIL